MLDRHGLRDHPTHRGADDVSPLDAERVEQADDVGRHVAQRIRWCRHHLPGQRRGHRRADVGDAELLEMPGQAAVAIVEADDVEAAPHEVAAEVVLPEDHLRAETHDQRERRFGGIAEGLVFDRDTVGRDVRHRCSYG